VPSGVESGRQVSVHSSSTGGFSNAMLLTAGIQIPAGPTLGRVIAQSSLTPSIGWPSSNTRAFAPAAPVPSETATTRLPVNVSVRLPSAPFLTAGPATGTVVIVPDEAGSPPAPGTRTSSSPTNLA